MEIGGNLLLVVWGECQDAGPLKLPYYCCLMVVTNRPRTVLTPHSESWCQKPSSLRSLSVHHVHDKNLSVHNVPDEDLRNVIDLSSSQRQQGASTQNHQEAWQGYVRQRM